MILRQHITRKTALILLIPALFVLLATGLSAQPFAYSVQSDGDDNLYLINLTTGESQVIGPVGFDDVEGIDLAPDGTLYGWDNESEQLIRIDPGTGAGTAIGGPGGEREGVPSLTICPDGTIYLAGLPENGSRGGGTSLFEVNPADGSLTEIGEMPAPGSIEAIACNDDGVLYGVNSLFDFRSPPQSHLWRIDRNDACTTDLGSLAFQFDQGEIDFGPDGFLYGINDGAVDLRREGSGDMRGDVPTPTSGPIYQIDIDAPSSLNIADTMPGGHESLSVLPDASVLEIPTTSQLGLGVFALLLLLATTLRLRHGA